MLPILSTQICIMVFSLFLFVCLFFHFQQSVLGLLDQAEVPCLHIHSPLWAPVNLGFEYLLFYIHIYFWKNVDLFQLGITNVFLFFCPTDHFVSDWTWCTASTLSLNASLWDNIRLRPPNTKIVSNGLYRLQLTHRLHPNVTPDVSFRGGHVGSDDIYQSHQFLVLGLWLYVDEGMVWRCAWRDGSPISVGLFLSGWCICRCRSTLDETLKSLFKFWVKVKFGWWCTYCTICFWWFVHGFCFFWICRLTTAQVTGDDELRPKLLLMSVSLLCTYDPDVELLIQDDTVLWPEVKYVS